MYTLDSGVELNKEFPDSFFIPTKEEKQALDVGSIVKLIFREEEEVERMWVSIQRPAVLKEGILHFTGVLDNEPYSLTTVKIDDVVNFTEDHIITIWEDINAE